MRLENRSAIITGAARGIGKAIAAIFAREGAKVTLVDIDERALEEAAAEFEGMGSAVFTETADVSNAGQAHVAVEGAGKAMGSVNVLVNNAGGPLGLHSTKEVEPWRIDEISEEQWDRVVDVNLKGTFLMCKAVMPWMCRSAKGSIINISSLAGRTQSGVSGLPYCSAKAGVLGLTRQLARELGPYNIRVNAIAPGLTLSGPRIERKWAALSDEGRNRILKDIPLKRLAKPREVATVALFLASDRSSYLTGTTIDVNGGRFML
ncbi:MAG: SDR family oxidoreductase [Deltaproteobacteria bacterium]|nr:SDR family oxidoreductase [Deltaproteobacteria bacterium]